MEEYKERIQTYLTSNEVTSSVLVFIEELIAYAESIPPAENRESKARPISETEEFEQKLEILKNQMQPSLYQLLIEFISYLKELQSIT